MKSLKEISKTESEKMCDIKTIGDLTNFLLEQYGEDFKIAHISFGDEYSIHNEPIDYYNETISFTYNRY